MTAVRNRLQVLPLRQHAFVVFHLGASDRPLEVVSLEPTYQVIENQRIGTLGAILRQHPDEQQVNDVRLVPLQNLQQVPPAKRQEASVACFLHGS